MARTRRAGVNTDKVAMNPAGRPGKSPDQTAQNGKTRHFAPAQKVHRAPRMTRKPLGNLDSNAQSAKKIVGSKAKGTKAKLPFTTAPKSPVDVLEEGSPSPPPTVATQPLAGTQRVADSFYELNDVTVPTPLAVEHSILALKNFRRRPRQPSMLNMVKQRIASARSSIAPDAPVFGSDDSLDLDDFLPDAAGTPLHSSGLYVVEPHDNAPMNIHSNKRKRSQTAAESVDSIDTVERSLLKYRKLVSQSSDGSGVADEAVNASQVGRIRSTPERAQEEDDDDDETSLHITELAAGSSPLSVSIVSPLSSGAQQSDINAPPMSQYTPPRKTRTAGKPVPAPSSAILQSLLPKRRKRFDTDRLVPALRLSDTQTDDHYDVPSSPIDVDIDTSEYAEAGHKRRVAAKVKPLRADARKTLRQKVAAGSRSGRDDESVQQAQNYSRRKARITTEKDVETHEDAHGPATSLDQASKSQELQAARRKFEEIDKWEMEFETLTNEESRSSSQNWR